jgi:hypothetical protein
MVVVSPIPVGNALRVQVAPPAGAVAWNLLRNTADTFAGPTDPAATLVAFSNEPVIYDAIGLTNGLTYWYQAYYWDGLAWTADPQSASGVPASTYADQSTDALTLLLDRVTAGMANEVATGRLTPGEKANGVISVFSAPPIFEQVQFPVVVLHLSNEAPEQYGLGELVAQDTLDTSGLWDEGEGYLARTTISVTGWTLNPDARIALRRALRRVMIANNQIFATAGLREVTFSQTDEDELSGTYGAPVYFTVGTFTCLSPLLVSGQVAPIADITVTVNPVPPNFSETISLGSP